MAVRIIDDPARAQALAGVSGDYDRARPTYPVEAVRRLSGRGPSTSSISARHRKPTAVLVGDGHRVVAVEPLERRLAQKLPATWDEHPDLGGR